MKLKQILKISLSEFKRSNTKINRKIFYILFPTLILVLFFLFIFLSSDNMFQSKFYSIKFVNDNELVYLDARFYEKDQADIAIDFLNRVYIYNEDHFRSKAATELFIKNIKLHNDIIASQLEDEFRFPVLIKTELVRRNDNLQTNMFESEIIEIEEINEQINEDETSIIDEEIINIQIEDNEEISNNEIITNNIEFNFTTNEKREDGLITPSEISPSLPFEPIYLALIVIVVLTFLSLIYSNRIYDEKINSKGLLLLASPISKWDIIVGKTLPFMVLTLIIAIIIGVVKTNSFYHTLLLSLIIIPIILVYFSISLFTALISRSFKELSFLGIFNISLYSLFLLIPTFMISFSEASLASPLTIIVKIIMLENIPFEIILFSILPSLFLALIIFLVSGSLFNSENLFSYKSIYQKIMKVYEHNVNNLKQLFYVSIACVPFIYFLQLGLIVIMISLNLGTRIYLILLLSAFFEEGFKSLGIISLFKTNKIKKNVKKSVIAGTVTGIGFFLAEKFMLLLMITPFITQYNLIVLSGLIIPLILHSLLSIIFALGINKTKIHSGIMIIIVSILHFFANVALINYFN